MACIKFNPGKERDNLIKYADKWALALQSKPVESVTESVKLDLAEYFQQLIDQGYNYEKSIENSLKMVLLSRGVPSQTVIQVFSDVNSLDIFENILAKPVVEGERKIDVLSTKDEIEEPLTIADKVRLKDINKHYKKAIGLMSEMLFNFKKEIVNSLTINRRSGNVIKTSEDLNNYITSYQKSLIEDIRKFIVEDNMLSPILTNPLWRDDTNILQLMKVINSSGLFNITSGQLLDLEAKRISDVKARLKVNAYNAYVILNNFDMLLKLQYGREININNAEYGSLKNSSNTKYTLINKSSNMNSGFIEKDELGMENEMDNKSKAIIESFDVYDSSTKELSIGRRFQVNEFLYCINQIKSLANKDININFDDIIKSEAENPNSEELLKRLNKLREDKCYSLKDLIALARTNPTYYYKQMFELLCDPYFFNNLGSTMQFNKLQRDYIYTIYKNIFERNRTRENSLYSLYDIYSSNDQSVKNYYGYLTHIMNSTTPVDYYAYEFKDGEVVTNNFKNGVANSIKRRLEDTMNAQYSPLVYTSPSEFKNDFSKLTYEDGRFTIKASYQFTLVFDPIMHKTTIFRYGIQTEVFNESDFDNLTPFFDKLIYPRIGDNEVFRNILIDSEYSDNGIADYSTLVSELALFSSAMLFNNYFNNVIVKEEGANTNDKVKELIVTHYGDAKINQLMGSLDINVIQGSIGASYPVLEHLVNAYSYSSGIFANNNVKDNNNNNLPVNGLTRLIDSLPTQWKTQNSKADSASNHFPLIANPNLYKGYSMVREAKIGDVVKPRSKFSVAESYTASFLYDFIRNIVGEESTYSTSKPGRCGFLSSVNADKNTILTVYFDLMQKAIGNKNYLELTSEELNGLIVETFGSFYNKILNNMDLTYTKLVSFIEQNPSLFFNTEIINSSKFSFIIQQLQNPLQNNFSGWNKSFQNPRETMNLALSLYNEQNPTDQIQLINNYAFKDTGGILSTPLVLIYGARLFKTSSNPRSTARFFRTMSNATSKKVFGIETSYFTEYNDFIKNKEFSLFNELMNENFYIETYDISGKPKKSKDIEYLKKVTGWAENNNIILAKITDENGQKHNITSSRDLQYVWQSKENGKKVNFFSPEFDKDEIGFELNPVMSQHNKLDYLLTEQWLFATVGTHLAHVIKGSKYATAEEMDSDASKAQNKRNSAITASSQVFQQGLIDGIGSKLNFAIVEDSRELAYNILGELKNTSPFDGMTVTNGFQIYLEDNSLGGTAGGRTKKPHGHMYNERTGSGFQLKTATFGLTNATMQNSKMQQLWMKKMTDKLWRNEDGTFATLDITKDYDGNTISYIGNQFTVYNPETKEKGIAMVTKVESLGNNMYNFVYRVVPLNGGTEYSQTSQLLINSNYTLWNALGGVKSCTIDKNGEISVSEDSILGVVKAINYVGNYRTKNPEDVLSQRDVYQPLKFSDIHYMATEGAVKVGAANVNLAKTYNDESDWAFVTLSPNQLGSQSDPNHAPEESEISIMTQVISALSFRGYTMDQADEVYKALHSLATSVLGGSVDLLSNYVKGTGTTELQDFMADLVIKSLQSATKESGFLAKLSANLLEEVNLGTKVKYADLAAKISFSNPYVFNKIVSDIVSTINKKAIKGKFAGLLAVLNPSVGIYKLYGDKLYGEFNDENEIAELQRTKYDTNPIDVHSINIGRSYKLTVNGVTENILIKSPMDYWDLVKRVGTDYTLVEDITNGRDLAPYNITFTTSDDKSYSMWDLDIIKSYYDITDTLSGLRKLLDNPINSINYITSVQQSQDKIQSILQAWNINVDYNVRDYSPEQWEELYIKQKDSVILLNKALQSTLNKLAAKEVGTVMVDKLPVSLKTVNVQPYELITNNIHKTKFGLRSTDSISDILEKGSDFFYQRLIKLNEGTSPIADLILKRVNGNHLYIKLRSISDINVDKLYTKVSIQTNSVDDVLYRLDSNGNTMYPLSSLMDDVYLDENGNEVIYTDNSEFYLENMDYSSIDFSDAIKNTDGSFDAAKVAKIFSFLFTVNQGDLVLTNDTYESKNKTLNDFVEPLIDAMLDEEDDDSGVLKMVKAVIENLREGSENYEDKMAKKANELFTSFQHSLNYIVSRTPSQSMQSFMAMKQVAFDHTNVNSAYVSHWQIWLQGSDFDVDKASLLNYIVNYGGKIVTWSPFISLNNIEELNATKDLSFPNGNKVNLTLGSTIINPIQSNMDKYLVESENQRKPKDYTGEVSEVFEPEEGRDYLTQFLTWVRKHNINVPRYLVNTENLVNFVNSSSDILDDAEIGIPDLTGSRLSDISTSTIIQLAKIQSARRLLDKHNTYFINNKSVDIADALKNFISDRIYSISVSPSNLIQSQSPITLGEPKEVADNSFLGKLSKTATPGNTVAKHRSIEENMVGKEVIGITAIGLKVFAGLTHYFNKQLSNGKVENLKFRKVINGVNYMTLANANFKDEVQYKEVTGENGQVYKVLQNPDGTNTTIEITSEQDAALVISSLLSAATDNAKELVLSKINAGASTVSFYLYGIMINMKFKEAAAIMLSDTARTLIKLNTTNMFTNKKAFTNMTSVLRYLDNGPISPLKSASILESTNKIFGADTEDRLKNKNWVAKTIINSVKVYKDLDYVTYKLQQATQENNEEGIRHYTERLEILNDKIRSGELYPIQSLRDKIKSLKSFTSSLSEGSMKQLADFKSYINSLYDLIDTLMIVNNKDLNNLRKLNYGASELRRLGSILSYNQGFRTKVPELLGTIEKFSTLISDRIDELENWEKKNSIEAINDFKDIYKTTEVDLSKFFFDENYRNDVINLYDKIKHTFNIMDCIWTLPQVRGYLQSLLTIKGGMESISNKFILLQDLGKTVSSTYNFKSKTDLERMYKNIASFYDTIILNKWFREDVPVITPRKNKFVSEDIKLGTLEGNALFKDYIEKFVIPQMQAGNYDEEDHFGNLFIDSLSRTKVIRTQTGNMTTVFALPINSYATSDAELQQLLQFRNEFNRLNTKSFGGIPVYTLLYYYDLINFKGSSTKNSLSPFFENIIIDGYFPPYASYNTYLSLFDKNGGLTMNEDYDKDELLKWCAPFGNTFDSSALYVRAKNRDTLKVDLYKRKSSYKPEVNDDSPMEELEYDFMDVLGYDASEDKSTPLFNSDKYEPVNDEIISELSPLTTNKLNNSESTGYTVKTNKEGKITELQLSNKTIKGIPQIAVELAKLKINSEIENLKEKEKVSSSPTIKESLNASIKKLQSLDFKEPKVEVISEDNAEEQITSLKSESDDLIEQYIKSIETTPAFVDVLLQELNKKC